MDLKNAGFFVFFVLKDENMSCVKQIIEVGKIFHNQTYVKLRFI
jgi:hypothetical protein